MSEPKRYDLVTNYRAGSSIEEMEPADDGEWVRYEDVKGAWIEPLKRSDDPMEAEACRMTPDYVLMTREAAKQLGIL